MKHEKHELLVKYRRKAKDELDLKRYVRFKMIVYFFPEVICEPRLMMLLEAIKDDCNFMLMLNEYESRKSDYNIFSKCLICRCNENENQSVYFLPIYDFYKILGI